LASELFESVKIPKERVAVLIGSEGKVKRKLEKLASVVVEVDSKTGNVEVGGKGNTENFFEAVNAVKAIGRGFSPENAFGLIGQDNVLEVINMRGIIGGGEKALQTKRGRIIGREGKAREQIEKATGTKISVFGKTVSIVGQAEDVETAKKAVEMLLEGARHQSVTGFLEREKRETKKFTI